MTKVDITGRVAILKQHIVALRPFQQILSQYVGDLDQAARGLPCLPRHEFDDLRQKVFDEALCLGIEIPSHPSISPAGLVRVRKKEIEREIIDVEDFGEKLKLLVADGMAACRSQPCMSDTEFKTHREEVVREGYRLRFWKVEVYLHMRFDGHPFHWDNVEVT